MSLRRALDRLPCDRDTEAAMRRIIALFHDHVGEGYSRARVALSADVQMELAETVLSALEDAFVLDFSGDPPTYRFSGDRATEIEFDRFLRSSGRHAGEVRNNVEKFRQRYGR
jgi:hypothetical protein